MRFLGSIAIFACVIGSAFAAGDLQSMKASRRVCEKGDGYVRATDSADSEATTLVDKVNTGRRQKYEDIARGKGISVDAVAAIAASELGNNCS